MCGILCIASGADQPEKVDPSGIPTCYSDVLTSRGPDCQSSCQVRHGSIQLLFAASLLQLRGHSQPACPLRDARGNVLCFNGEIFGGLHVPAGENDGRVLLQALGAAAEGDLPRLLSSLEGPWALVYWRADSGALWYGRDVMGRRSLLLHMPSPEAPRLVLSSVSPLDGPGSYQPPQPASTTAAAAHAADAAAAAGAANDAQATSEAEGSDVDAAGDTSCSGYWQEVRPGIYSMQLPPARPAAYACDSRGSAGGSSARDGLSLQQLQQVCAPVQHAWLKPELYLLSRQQLNREQEEAHAAAAAGQAEQQEQQQDQNASNAASQGSSAAYSSLSSAMSAPAFDASLQPGASAPAAEGAGELQRALGPLTQLQPRRQHLQVAAAGALLRVLEAAVRVRCRCIDGKSSSSTAAGGLHGAFLARPSGPHAAAMLPPAPVLLLFSGGVDSVLLAALAHRVLPAGAPVDLANVCFDGGRSPDRLAARSALEELAAACPGRTWRLIEVDRRLEDVDVQRGRLLALLQPAATVMDINIGAALWCAASGEGRLRLPAAGGAGVAEAAAAGLSAEALDHQPEALEHQLEVMAVGAGPGRSDEASAAQQPQAPAQRQQQLQGARYRSAARVVLLGHGADEQCAGYGRHRTRFRAGGWEGLRDELALDMGRLWQRNLGRDDRLVADQGREARHPFLDEGVMWLLGYGLPLDLVADLHLAPGVGDKAVLRTALRMLGLPQAAARVKRAIQFGSRIGKLSNMREFGSNRAANRRNAGSVLLQDLPSAS